jgi:hypothetical protein
MDQGVEVRSTLQNKLTLTPLHTKARVIMPLTL